MQLNRRSLAVLDAAGLGDAAPVGSQAYSLDGVASMKKGGALKIWRFGGSSGVRLRRRCKLDPSLKARTIRIFYKL